MSDYDGTYIKVRDTSAYWRVDDGEREQMCDMAHVYAVGLRPVVQVTQEEFDAIPIKGAKRKGAKRNANIHGREGDTVESGGGGNRGSATPDEVCLVDAVLLREEGD